MLITHICVTFAEHLGIVASC